MGNRPATESRSAKGQSGLADHKLTMNYRRQHTLTRLPLSVTPSVELFALDKRSQSDVHESPFYYLQSLRNGVLGRLQSGAGGDGLQMKARLWEETYIRQAPTFANDLADFVASSCSTGFDLLASVPTTREALLLPYCQAFARRFPSASNSTGSLVRVETWDSSKAISIDECIKAVHFKQEPQSRPADRILVIDDVLASGKSAAVVIEFLRRHYDPSPTYFAVACPLWISTGTS